ncbi:MAG: hypothetical protein Q4A71_04545 [Actinomycetaceae bacterium]|nr:hypothetical protein [Actinomycetaceae bacterium]
MGSTISLVLSACALIIAIWAAIESHRANTRSAEANRIAESANTLAEKSNEHADKANLISAQALELAEREAPAPLSELVQLEKDKWAFTNQSGRVIELLTISVLPDEAVQFVHCSSLPHLLDYGDQYTLNIFGV